MSVSLVTRATVVALALTVAGVPIARRLCGLTCDAAPSPASASAHGRHCPAHPAPPGGDAPKTRPNPCGHAHGGDGALRTASAPLAKAGARDSEPAAPLVLHATHPIRMAPCAFRREVDRRLALPPPAVRRPILRL